MDYLNYVLNDDLKYQVLKELAENKTISRKELSEKFGTHIIDILNARKLIIRVFVKRGLSIRSFYRLSISGTEVFFTAKAFKGD